MKWTDDKDKTHDLQPLGPDDGFYCKEGREMLVWDENNPRIKKVYAFVPEREYGVIVDLPFVFSYCAPIPTPKKRRMTNRELAKWLAQGNGEAMPCNGGTYTALPYHRGHGNDPCNYETKIRTWDETEWREPEVEV